jgi:hypothetical protein
VAFQAHLRPGALERRRTSRACAQRVATRPPLPRRPGPPTHAGPRLEPHIPRLHAVQESPRSMRRLVPRPASAPHRARPRRTPASLARSPRRPGPPIYASALQQGRGAVYKRALSPALVHERTTAPPPCSAAPTLVPPRQAPPSVPCHQHLAPQPLLQHPLELSDLFVAQLCPCIRWRTTACGCRPPALPSRLPGRFPAATCSEHGLICH